DWIWLCSAGWPQTPGLQRSSLLSHLWGWDSVTTGAGKTRTKDKYRVVYTDHQRLELEKEFHYSRYITIRRKSELAANLGLTERQVKIWFQNRRAKERKVNKKQQQQQQQQQPPPPQLPPALDGTSAPAGPPLGGLCPSSAGLLAASSPMPVKEEFLP
uniref:Homeobox domain-containing protein n=1 Tax=Marmota marmota marmota TaxID=9994 RepID=A0A8C5ZZ55_MARMA